MRPMMRFSFKCLLAAALAVASLSACKKEETTKTYMSGSLNVHTGMYTYVKPGDWYSLKDSIWKKENWKFIGTH